jgi:excisionase family DNA binding protein
VSAALSLDEVAQELGVSYSMVRKLIATEGLPYVPLGTRKIVRREDLESWIAARVKVSKRGG